MKLKLKTSTKIQIKIVLYIFSGLVLLIGTYVHHAYYEAQFSELSLATLLAGIWLGKSIGKFELKTNTMFETYELLLKIDNMGKRLTLLEKKKQKKNGEN